MQNTKKQATDINSSGFLSTAYNPFWTSSLFNEVYLRNESSQSFIKELASRKSEFDQFQERFLRFANKSSKASNLKQSEADTIRSWIIPVLKMLSWHSNCDETIDESPYVEEFSFTVEDRGIKRIYRADLLLVDYPDHAKFLTKKQSNEEKIAAARDPNTGPILVVEAKKWDELDLSRHGGADKKEAERSSGQVTGETYEEQVLTYMKHLNLEFGVLTDGKVWKLFHRDLSKGDFKKRSFDFNLGKLADSIRTEGDSEVVRQQNLENLKLFFTMFSKHSFPLNKKNKDAFLCRLIDHSRKYAIDIEAELKERFVGAMGIACNAFKDSVKASGEELNLDLIRNTAESHLFNILFVRSCESRRVLPIHAPDYQKRSLAYIIGQIDDMEFEPSHIDLRGFPKKYAEMFDPSVLEGFELYEHLMRLYTVIHDGTKGGSFGFEIEGFRESVFSESEWKFSKKHRINNRGMLLILFHLNFSENKTRGESGRKYQQIPYSFFLPRQLGSIYESFLEFQLEEANSYMLFHKKQWQAAQKNSENAKKLVARGIPEVEKGELYFSPNNKDRKMTGSYYTPDYIAEYIVEEALGSISRGLTSKQLLALTVCDPSMGSGHFLSEALQYLTRKLRQLRSEETLSDLNEPPEISARKVLDSCIYGIDVNPRAVKLTKLSLWLMSACAGKKLEHLDDQLRCADTLADATDWKSIFKKVFSNGGFDAVIGNPPYIKEANNKDLFDRYKAQTIFQYFQGKMDLCYAFTCLSIDILKDGGLHSFIAPSTWIKSEGATKTIAKVKEECEFIEYIDFGDIKVFKESSIQTMIYLMRKNRPSKSTTTKYLCVEGKNLPESKVAEILQSTKRTARVSFDNDKISFIDAGQREIEEAIAEKNTYTLSDEEIGNGIDVLQDTVSQSHLKTLSGSIKKGDGIFAISSNERKKIIQCDDDKRKIKPYFTAEDLETYYVSGSNKQWLIYADEEVRRDIKRFKGIKAHLDKFASVMTSAYKPYGLHRPREEKWFEGEKILSVRKTPTPSFSISYGPCYVARTFMIIKPKREESIEYIVAVLNSSVSHYILRVRGKKQGNQLQIDKEPLKLIPIRKINFRVAKEKAAHDEITALIRKAKNQSEEAREQTKNKIDLLVLKLYGLTLEKMTPALSGQVDNDHEVAA